MMDNEDITQEEIVQETGENAEPETDTQEEQLNELHAEITELKIRLALLVGGAAPEKLDEGVKLAAGILAADEITPEEAAAEVLSEYPHIRLVKRTVPRISAESGGRGDGFAAIRSIFARK